MPGSAMVDAQFAAVAEATVMNVDGEIEATMPRCRSGSLETQQKPEWTQSHCGGSSTPTKTSFPVSEESSMKKINERSMFSLHRLNLLVPSRR